MKRATALWTAGWLAIIALTAWSGRARLILAAKPFLFTDKGESGGEAFRDSLIWCGQSSITPTINTLREKSSRRRGYCYLPQVLKHFGEPARQELLKAIDAETNPRRRLNLIESLQKAFGDYPRFDLWLSEKTISPFDVNWMERDVRYQFPDAPPLGFGNAINPDFAEWWSSQKPKQKSPASGF